MKSNRKRIDELDCTGKVVLPGFVDSHTHPVFVAPRLVDFEKRVAGATYEQIAAAGGGIRSSVDGVRKAGLPACVPADKLKDALLASLSHDLRTPLTTIKGLAHELQPLGDERTLIIEEQADRLNRLVTALLDVARLDGGALPLDIQLNAADDLLGAVVQHVSGRPDRTRLRVALDDPASLSLGHFDFVHSLRILANLVDNALKYAPVDTPIDVTGGLDNGEIVFRVADRGSGIPASERDRMFTPFYRPVGRVADAGSAGLGLSIARRLAEAQSGTLRYSDRHGGGSVFELRLPAASTPS